MKKKILNLLLSIIFMVPFVFGLTACGDIGESVMVFFHFNDYNSSTKAKFTDLYKEKRDLKEDYSGIGFVSWEYKDLMKVAPSVEDIIPPTFMEGEEGAKVEKKKFFGGWYYDSNCTIGNSLNKETWDELEAVKKHESFSLFAKWLDEGENIISFNL